MRYDLRSIAPVKIENGGALFSDGRAVGYVLGGTPVEEMVARTRLSQQVRSFHQLLLAREAKLHIHTYDVPLNMRDEMVYLIRQQDHVDNPKLALVLGEIADRLNESAQSGRTRTVMTVWSIDVGASLIGQLGRFGLRKSSADAVTQRGEPALRRAIQEARMLAEALRALDGYPYPRLMQQSEIEQLCYRAADPIRAERAALVGSLRARIRSLVSLHPDEEERIYGAA